MSKKVLAAAGTGTAVMVACICVLCVGLAVIGQPPTFRATQTARAVASASQGEAHAETPTTAPTATASPIPTASPVTYVVQSGDSLSSIAARFGTTADAIMKLNGLTSTTIYSGTLLAIPSDEVRHSISEGETEVPVATDAPVPTPTRRATQTPRARQTVRYMFCGDCGTESKRSDPIELWGGRVKFTWDQGGTTTFGMRLNNVATGASLLVVEPTVGHMAGSESVVVGGGLYQLRVWCYPSAGNFCVYVEQ